MTLQDDGIVTWRLSDVSAPLVTAVHEAAASFAQSWRMDQTQAHLDAIHGPQSRQVYLLKGQPMLVPAEKTFLVRTADASLTAFGTDPAWLVTLEHLIGARVALQEAAIWVALVPPSDYVPIMSQRWHRDPIEPKSLRKVFWYLRDVDETNGPFEFIRGSQERIPPRGLAAFDRYMSPRQERQWTAHPKRLVVTGPANTIIVADTSGVHRGGLCRSARRLSATFVYELQT